MGTNLASFLTYKLLKKKTVIPRLNTLDYLNQKSAPVQKSAPMSKTVPLGAKKKKVLP